MSTVSCTYRQHGRTWVRYPADGSRLADGTGSYAFCLSGADETPTVLGSDYDQGCGHCWLGSPHSQALHDYRMARTASPYS